MRFKENREMREMTSYPNIDMKKTGLHLKQLIEQEGYTVKDIQRLLHLACPQPVYRWFKGQVLPSVDHLYALSKLLYVHMEELLFPTEVLPLRNIRGKTERGRENYAKNHALSDIFVSDKACLSGQGTLMSKAADCYEYRRLEIYWMALLLLF